MNKRLAVYMPVFLAIAMVLGMFIGLLLLPSVIQNKTSLLRGAGSSNKIGEIINLISQHYVDSVSVADLEQKAINGMLQSLDPHSVYISADEFKNSNDMLKGRFEGVGIQFRIIRDSITVIAVIPGGPSEKAGLLAGDRIVKINDEQVAGTKIKEEDAMKKLKGPGGTKVRVILYRKKTGALIEKTITRGEIPTSSIDIAYMPQKETGYIKLSRFSGRSTEEFVEAVQNLKNQGMKKLIFDLRSNGGGLLDAAVELADELLPDKTLIVYTEGFHRSKMKYFASKRGNFEKGEVVILIDEFSASASEILAGAIQDNDRGIIIGRRSFGKGLVQEQIQLPDKSAIRLTIARYHTPTGRCIQRKYTGNTEEYYLDFYNELINENVNLDSLNFLDTTRYFTPGGKKVYGGGGIMPDIYIPVKTEFRSNLLRQLLNKGVFINFGFDYADNHRQQLLSYKDAGNFVRNYQVSSALFQEFLQYASANGVKINNDELSAAQQEIKIYLKAYIGRNIFNDEAFYPLILPVDAVFKEALEVLNEKK